MEQPNKERLGDKLADLQVSKVRLDAEIVGAKQTLGDLEAQRSELEDRIADTFDELNDLE